MRVSCIQRTGSVELSGFREVNLQAEARVPSHSDQFERALRWLLVTSTVLMVCIVAGDGLFPFRRCISVCLLPFRAGLFFALQRVREGNRAAFAAMVVLFVGSTAVLATWVQALIHMPSVDACLVSLFAAVSILGFGLYALGRLDLSAGIFSVTLLLALAIAAQTAIVVAAELQANGLHSPLMRLWRPYRWGLHSSSPPRSFRRGNGILDTSLLQ